MAPKPRDMQAELEASRRDARRNFSASLMSNTKWRSLFSALLECDLDIRQMVVKFIGSEKLHETTLPSLHPPHPLVNTEFGPIPLVELEWIEFPETAISPRLNNLPAERFSQDVDAIRTVIEGTGKLYPLERTATGLRVLGHVR